MVVPWKKACAPRPSANPVELAVATLESGPGRRIGGGADSGRPALGRIGPPAAAVAPRLIALLKEADETVRCQAAEALGEVGGQDGGHGRPHWSSCCKDASAPVKASAARALGALKNGGRTGGPGARSALAGPGRVGAHGGGRGHRAGRAARPGRHGHPGRRLASPDNVVRAQTAEALGTIGAAAEEAAPALVEAMADDNDRVRAKAVEALGKIGESAAEAAVPGLVRALRDQDNWVSALAAEALGQMGESADGAIPALVRSLSHLNPQVRRNAAEALGKMGGAAAAARPALEEAARDEDGGVRSQAIRALGAIGLPTPASAQLVLAGLPGRRPSGASRRRGVRGPVGRAERGDLERPDASCWKTRMTR